MKKMLMMDKIEGRRGRGWQRMRWLYSITDSKDMNLSKFPETVEHGGAWGAAVLGGHKALDHDLVTEQKRVRELRTLTKIRFSSVAQSCPTLCDPMDCITPGPPVHHQLLEFTQTHVY